MPVNYDNSAWFYDRLSRLVYGDAIIKAQLFLLECIPPASTVLIVGGGTGWILEKIGDLYPEGLNITYVESSARMMALSKKRSAGGNQIVYINEIIQNIRLDAGYDVVITPFLFDNFAEDTLAEVFGKIDSVLKNDGSWLYADFQLTGKWWQPLLLKTMLLFFKLLCGVEASRLPDVASHFRQHLYTKTACKTFFGSFITAQILKKTASAIPGRQTCNRYP